MSKRTYFVLMALAGIATIIWLARSHKIVKVESAAPGQIGTTTDPTRPASQLPEGRLAETEIQESKRHAADEIENHRRAASAGMDQAILDQGAKVEERRKVLATIVRTKGIIYKGSDLPKLEMVTDSLKSVEVNKNNAREEAIKRGLDAQDYVDAKREFETDQQLLQEMKLKQIKETLNKGGFGFPSPDS